MPTPDELVAQAIAYFFDSALPQATGRRYAQLPAPSTHLGAYVRSDGQPVTAAGQQLTPAYALRVSPALPVAGDRPNPAGVAAPTSGPLRHLLWTRTVADPVVDDAAEIQRVMADLDSFVDLFGTAATGAAAAGGGTPAAGGTTADGAAGPAGGAAEGTPAGGGAQGERPGARAAEWAAAIVASRAALGGNLSALTAVPPALDAVAPDLGALKEVLQHFFCYGDDGAYYPRWAGAGRDAANPAHLSAAYLQRNLRELQLERDRVYLYGMLPESALSGAGDLGQPAFREFVIRFTPTGLADRPFDLATVHSVRVRVAAGPYSDFVFFHAAEGLGIPVPRAALDTMSARLVGLVGRLTGNDSLETVLATSDATAEAVSADGGTGPLVHLIATLDGEPTLPAGVVSASSDPVRVLLSPPDAIPAIAALPQVRHLGLLAPSAISNDQARTMVNHSGLDAKLPAGNKGGQGVLVGVIDSGIDGSHPAFAGRIHAVWDQGNPTTAAGNTPAANHPGNAAYAAFNFGVELTGAAVANSGDPNPAPGSPVAPANGHGTHVAGTAAGAEVRDGAGNVLMPAGMAPNARIAVVRAIQAGRGNPVLGVQWIFQKAAELGVPCVINMSFGHHFHGHDGSDDMSRNMLGLCRDAAGNYRPGRILVAAASNNRRDNIHLRRSLPANSGRVTIGYVQVAGVREQEVIVWVRDPTGGKPAAFPLSVYLYRKTQRRNTYKDVTRAVTLGSHASSGSTPPTTPAGTFGNHRTIVEVTSTLSDPINGDHAFHLKFRTTDPTGNLPMIGNQWGIVLVNGSASPLDVHFWVPNGPAEFLEATRDDDHAYLVGTPAASAATVSVASCNSRLNWTDAGGGGRTATGEARTREISSFSSPGPLRASSIPPATFNKVTHEVNAIDVTAPGAFLQSALSSQVATPAWLAIPGNAAWVNNNRSRMMSGTSMATPVVTGLIANLLSVEPTLTLPQVLDRLKAAADIPADSDYQPPPGGTGKKLSVDWGYGLLDASKLRP